MRVMPVVLFALALIGPAMAAPDETYLENIRQLTREAEFSKAGEAYFNREGTRVVFQAVVPGKHPYYQIYIMNADGGEPRLVSPGQGKTTCAFFRPGSSEFLYASTHLDPRTFTKPEEPKDARRRYLWDYDGSFDIFVGDANTGKILRRLTDGDGYDAEASYSHDGETICYTRRREGKPDAIWLMNADGTNKRPLIERNDLACGGPFFSPDDRWVLYRAIKSGGRTMHSYLTSIDGETTRKLTTLSRINWAPYFHPSGEAVAYGANMPGSRANFDVILVKPDGSGREVQLTFNKSFDGLPTFSPDGKQLLWTSKRGGADSQVYIADFIMPPDSAFVVPKKAEPSVHGHSGERPTSRPKK